MKFRKIRICLGIFALFTITLLLNACKDAYNFDMDKLTTDTKLNPVFAIPLIDASISLEELLPDDDEVDRYLYIDEETKFMTINFETDLEEYNIDDFMDGVPLTGPSLPFVEYKIDPQIMELSLNNVLNGGSIHLANPSIKLFIKNYWNIPAKFQFADFYYYEEENSPAIPLTGSFLSEWIELGAPATSGDSVITEIVIDTSTTNIDEMLSAMPHHISFSANFETIPGTPYNVPAGSVNKVAIELSLPLELSLSNIQLTDTIEFDLGEDIDSALVESVKINLSTNNGFPLGIDAQIYFVDENYAVLDSLFDNNLNINPALVGSDGKVGETEHIDDDNTISLNGAKIKNLLKAKHLIPNIVFNTTDSDNNVDVKLYSDYSFGLKMGALIELQAETNDF
jgi:hypothetical protein